MTHFFAEHRLTYIRGPEVPHESFESAPDRVPHTPTETARKRFELIASQTMGMADDINDPVAREEWRQRVADEQRRAGDQLQANTSAVLQSMHADVPGEWPLAA